MLLVSEKDESFPPRSEAFYPQALAFVLLSQKCRSCYQEVPRSSPVLLMLPEDKGLYKSDDQLEPDQHDCILVFFL